MPKTFKNLYPQVHAFDNLYRAHRKARRGGKRKRPEVAAFEHDLGENLLRLQQELVEQSYRPGPYRHFIVVDLGRALPGPGLASRADERDPADL
jgi:retron-type reverse transcriptase